MRAGQIGLAIPKLWQGVYVSNLPGATPEAGRGRLQARLGARIGEASLAHRGHQRHASAAGMGRLDRNADGDLATLHVRPEQLVGANRLANIDDGRKALHALVRDGDVLGRRPIIAPPSMSGAWPS